jgi:adenylylsulfate kinase
VPYEQPETPEFIIEIDKLTIEQGVSQILSYLENHGVIGTKNSFINL